MCRRTPARFSIATACLALVVGVAPALAQSPFGPLAPGSPGASTITGQNGTVTLSAVFAGNAKPIGSGLVWRIYEERQGAAPQLLAKSDEPNPAFTLPSGTYLVHAAFGFASDQRPIVVRPGNSEERLTINAGGLRLSGAIGETRIPRNRLKFAVFLPIGTNSEGRLIRDNVMAGDIVRLPEATYHVVSTYGESNAIARSDLRVENGRVTDATLNHRAATLTLKLVGAAGGEAIAGTAFSVLTPGGDVIREAIGAFPSVTLAEGEYMLIARRDGQLYTREFKVESGKDRDVEILAQAAPTPAAEQAPKGRP